MRLRDSCLHRLDTIQMYEFPFEIMADTPSNVCFVYIHKSYTHHTIFSTFFFLIRTSFVGERAYGFVRVDASFLFFFIFIV